MHQFYTLSVALLATCALAAPAPKQKHDSHIGHFAAAVKNHKSKGPVNPLSEMKHVFGKYDWKFDIEKFDVNIPHFDIPKLGQSKGSPGADKPKGPPGAAHKASRHINVPDLLNNIGDAVGDTLDTLLGGGNDGAEYGDAPKTTLSKLVKTTTIKSKKPKSTGVSSASAVQPSVAPTSSAAPAPPPYSAPASESTESAPAYSAPAETSSTAPAYSAPAETSSVAPVESSSVESPSVAPVTSSSAEASSAAPVTSSTVEMSSAAPVASTPAETPSSTPEPATSSVGSYTPSFTFEPTTSAAVESSSVVPQQPSSAPIVVSSEAPPASSAAPTSSSVVVVPSSTKQSTGGKVTAKPEPNESEYLSPVTVGGQTLDLNFDTGSADLWVFSSSLTEAQRANHTAFDPSKSTTWQPADGYTWSIAYGDGSAASGTVGHDTVVVGGATATGQAVELATAVSSKFSGDANNDGLVGLAFSSINTVKPTQQKTFFENIMPNLDKPLFTADLREDTAVSTYEFGVIDTSKYHGDVHYTPIDSSQGHWQFTSTTYTINGQSYTNANAAPAIADTGTSLILADQATVTAYYGAVSGSSFNSQVGGYTYSCSATLPEFGIQIGSGGFTAVIPGASMTYAPLGDGNCFGALQSNGGGNYQILGDTLFKQYFVIFNGGEKTLGLASKA